MQHNGDEHVKVEQSLVLAEDLACSVLRVKVNVVDAAARAHFCHQCDFFLQFLVVDITFSANSQESVLSEVSESREILLFQSPQSPAGKNFEKVEPPLSSLFIVLYLLASEYVKSRYSFIQQQVRIETAGNNCLKQLLQPNRPLFQLFALSPEI